MTKKDEMRAKLERAKILLDKARDQWTNDFIRDRVKILNDYVSVTFFL